MNLPFPNLGVVRSRLVVLLLVLYCLLSLPLFVGVPSFIFVLLFSTLCPSGFALIYLDGEERAGCFTLTVFLIFCDSKCSVTLPHDAMDWSAVCN